MTKFTTLSACLVACSLTACGVPAFVAPKSNPIITNKSQGEGRFYNTIATTAERRLVLIKQAGEDHLIDQQKKKKFIVEGFCAEPSPDAIEAVSASFEAAAKNTTAANSQELQLGQSLLTSAALATKRTQGLQYYRDTIFGLCQARLNSFITGDELIAELAKAREAAVKMVLAEVKSDGFNTQPQINVTVQQAVSEKKPETPVAN